MPGDQPIGAMLRELRTSRNLTLAVVAGQAGCAESLLSYVENGQLQLQPWLAKALDAVYRTGGAITTLASGAHAVPHTGCPAVTCSMMSWCCGCRKEGRRCRSLAGHCWPG